MSLVIVMFKKPVMGFERFELSGVVRYPAGIRRLVCRSHTVKTWAWSASIFKLNQCFRVAYT